ncbi:MAG: hypothetical protein KBT34_10450 [Prevotella sp.]|nr:hypothetical protein [Candidatus Prevotella equi]
MAVAARRTRTGYKQRYSSNNIQPTSAGRKNQAEQTSVNGRYYGSRQTYTNADTGKVARKGQNVTRETQYRDTRAAFNNMTEGVARAMLDAGQMTQAEYNRMHGAGGGGTGSLGLAVG